MLASKMKIVNGRVKTKDSKIKDKKMRDGQSYNMAVENELFTYYNIPRNQARLIVEHNSQELQKKEDAGVSARNAADMLIHKEGIKGFEKIYVRPNDSKTRDGEAEEAVIKAKLRANGDNVEAAKALMALGYSQADAFRTVKIWLENRDTVDPTQPKNIAAAKNLAKAQGKAASDGGPGERLINFAETDYVR